MKIVTRSVRKLFCDKTDTFIFKQCKDGDFILNPERDLDLYLHVPFCLSLCPYCPYNKVLFDGATAKDYVEAVRREIRLVFKRIGRRKFGSLYIGGGTPTLLLPELGKVIDELKSCFILGGPIAIETTPSDFTEGRISEMKQLGVNFLSLGVQSFQEKYLSFLGRNHDSAMASRAASLLRNKDFQVANIDLIFAYPGQSIEELSDDLTKAISFQPEQITCYPLFTFPYSKVGKFLKLKKVRMPNWRTRKKMYYVILDFFAKNGYYQSSVWSFSRKKNHKYSSVTRDYYLGFGAGAATYTGTDFYFNTFSIRDYVQATKDRIPVALRMKVSAKLEKLFWLYWRFYDTEIPIAQYKRIFGRPMSADFGGVINLFDKLGFFNSGSDGAIALSRRGAFWIHLLQNHFALNYVNTIWTNCQQESWPKQVAI